MLAAVENSVNPTRRRKTAAKEVQIPVEPAGGRGRKKKRPQEAEKAVENLSPSESEKNKQDFKRGVKRRLEKSPTRIFTYDAQWKLAAEIVAREREERERREQQEVLEDEEDLCELEPLTVLGIQGLKTSEQRTSMEKQNFQNSIAMHYFSDAEFGLNSGRLKNTGNRNNVPRLDDPFQPEVMGAKKRKLAFGKVKFMDLPSSKPFSRYDVYNLCASKKDSNGFDQHLLQWFAKPPTKPKDKRRR